MTDPFDEFEFKPLTEGLGFHKKKGSANNANPIQTPATPSVSTNTAAASAGLGPLPSRRQTFEDEAIENLLPPLPRKAPVKENSVEENSNTTVDEILKTLRQNQRLDFDNSKQAKQALKKPKVEEYQPTNWNLSSTFLDSMLIVASSLLCLIILLVITKVDLVANLAQPDDAGMIYVSTLSLFFGVSFIYMLVNRVFLGATPGEWAFDQRIGRPEDMNHPLYALRVAARCLLVIATGFIVLPIISLIMGRDIAGSITGAALYKKV